MRRLVAVALAALALTLTAVVPASADSSVKNDYAATVTQWYADYGSRHKVKSFKIRGNVDTWWRYNDVQLRLCQPWGCYWRTVATAVRPGQRVYVSVPRADSPSCWLRFDGDRFGPLNDYNVTIRMRCP